MQPCPIHFYLKYQLERAVPALRRARTVRCPSERNKSYLREKDRNNLFMVSKCKAAPLPVANLILIE